jgi:hypothetical protein
MGRRPPDIVAIRSIRSWASIDIAAFPVSGVPSISRD